MEKIKLFVTTETNYRHYHGDETIARCKDGVCVRSDNYGQTSGVVFGASDAWVGSTKEELVAAGFKYIGYTNRYFTANGIEYERYEDDIWRTSGLDGEDRPLGPDLTEVELIGKKDQQ
jgi:hypothetical protein